MFVSRRHMHQILELGEKLVASIDNLTNAVATLNASVDAAVAKIGAGGGGGSLDPQIQAAADAVNAAAQKLDAAVNPPVPPAPMPVPTP